MTAIPAVASVAAVATAAPAIAIVHDYFTQRGGAERVAERLAALFPDGAVFASVAAPDARPASLDGRSVGVSRLQALLDAGLPLGALAPLMPRAMAALPLAAGTRVVNRPRASAHSITSADNRPRPSAARRLPSTIGTSSSTAARCSA